MCNPIRQTHPYRFVLISLITQTHLYRFVLVSSIRQTHPYRFVLVSSITQTRPYRFVSVNPTLVINLCVHNSAEFIVVHIVQLCVLSKRLNDTLCAFSKRESEILLERGSRLFSAVLTDEHAVNHLIHLYLPLGRFTFIKKA